MISKNLTKMMKKIFLQQGSICRLLSRNFKKTYDQLRKLTDKKIISIPFWVDQSLWFEINNKQVLREKYGLNKTDYLVGSFQRDTEGHDLKSPKLIKGPDIFLEIVTSMYEKNKNLKVVLSGKEGII